MRLLLAREPTAAETRLLLDYTRAQSEAYARDPGAARQLLATGDKGPPAAAEDAAWFLAARAVMNTDGFITRE